MAYKTLHLTNPLMKGPAVEEAQKLLHAHGYYKGPIDGQFGSASGNACKRAKFDLGYRKKDIKPSYGHPLHGFLTGKIKLPTAYKVRQKIRRNAAKRRNSSESGRRKAIVANWRWMITDALRIHYQQRRPIDGEKTRHKSPLYTDCSGSTTDGYAWAGAPDPNGFNYNGLGYTGSMWNHMEHITRSELQPADLIEFGAYPGDHVVGYLGDGKVMSHGHEGQPDDPREYTLDQMISAFSGKPVTYLTLRKW